MTLWLTWRRVGHTGVDISKAESLSYSFYEECLQNWQEFDIRLESYNKDVARYNQEISGKVYVMGSADDLRTSAWEARLDEEAQALDEMAKELVYGFYEPLGIVEAIYVHWGD